MNAKKNFTSFFPFVFLLMLMAFLVTSCGSAKKYKSLGKKCASVKISDPGEIYSTYLINDAEKKFLKEEGFTDDQIKTIQEKGNESAWPASLNNFTSRIANPDKIKALKAYKLATLEDPVAKTDKKIILVIPAEKNKDAEDGWAPSEDIFLIIGPGGVSE